MQRSAFLESLTETEVATLNFDWPFWARPSQLAPSLTDAGQPWLTWLILAGRGFGKTRTGGEFIRGEVEAGRAGRIALIAPTAADARDTMVEGESGILSISPPWFRPIYEPSKRRLTWPNGAVATLFSAEEPERLRGPQHDLAWCDELAAWADARGTWDMLQFGLRLGMQPRQVVTTTPKPIEVLKEILGRSDTVVTRGGTRENAANLAPPFLQAIEARYAGTRLGRQELDGELLDDVPGALWTRATIDAARKPVALPEMSRVVVAVDPSGTRGAEDGGDSIGIIAAGRGVDGRAYVMADRSCKLSPAGWGRRAADTYREFGADRLVAERNFGGAMVEHVIRSVEPNVSYKEVTASRGKVIRAEPIAALYEQGRVSHVGPLADLEDQMCAMASDGYVGAGSPDRVDALVWALTELMLEAVPGQGLIDYYRSEASSLHSKPEDVAAVKLFAPEGTSTVYLADGRRLDVGPDRIVSVSPADAASLRRSGFKDA